MSRHHEARKCAPREKVIKCIKNKKIITAHAGRGSATEWRKSPRSAARVRGLKKEEKRDRRASIRTQAASLFPHTFALSYINSHLHRLTRLPQLWPKPTRWFHQRVSFYCCQFSRPLPLNVSSRETGAPSARATDNTCAAGGLRANQAAMKDHVQAKTTHPSPGLPTLRSRFIPGRLCEFGSRLFVCSG